MPIFQFTLIVDGPGLRDESSIDSLRETLRKMGHGDAAVRRSGDAHCIGFGREAKSFCDALLSAVDDLERFRGVEVVRMEIAESVSQASIGDGAGGVEAPVDSEDVLTAACNAALELRRHRRRLNPAEPVTLRELLGMHGSRTPSEPERQTGERLLSGQLPGTLGEDSQEYIDLDQLDLFNDSSSVQASNALRWALTNRDAGGSRRAHERLAAIDASHRWLPCAEHLIDALEMPAPAGSADALAILHLLDGDWTEAADEILGAGQHDLLMPIWRTVAAALAGADFDPEHPNRHASYAWMKGGDWASVEQAILGVPEYRSQSALLPRMAEAIWRQRRWFEAADHWFALCWQAPDEFAGLMERGRIPDATLRNGWDAGRDQDIEPGISAAWFPAWMLLHMPGLARKVAEAPGKSGPEAAFNTMVALATGSGAVASLRKRLQRLHPGLLSLLLERQ